MPSLPRKALRLNTGRGHPLHNGRGLAWRSWTAATGAAVVAGILIALALESSSAALGWFLVAAGVGCLVCPTLAARRLARSRNELLAFTFAAIMLLWPLILIATVIIASGSSPGSG